MLFLFSGLRSTTLVSCNLRIVIMNRAFLGFIAYKVLSDHLIDNTIYYYYDIANQTAQKMIWWSNLLMRLR